VCSVPGPSGTRDIDRWGHQYVSCGRVWDSAIYWIISCVFFDSVCVGLEKSVVNRRGDSRFRIDWALSWVMGRFWKKISRVHHDNAFLLRSSTKSAARRNLQNVWGASQSFRNVVSGTLQVPVQSGSASVGPRLMLTSKKCSCFF